MLYKLDYSCTLLETIHAMAGNSQFKNQKAQNLEKNPTYLMLSLLKYNDGKWKFRLSFVSLHPVEVQLFTVFLKQTSLVILGI